MASLPSNSRQRSQMLREKARGIQMDLTGHSIASSTGSNHGTISTNSTLSEFNPDGDEGIMSTRRMQENLSQRLPEIRDTAKKYGRWAPKRQADIVINTSAIGRAFPDFSQGGSSDDDLSIEIGRGAKSRQRTPSRHPIAEYSDNLDSPVVTIGDFQILSTPPRDASKTSLLHDALRNSSKKEVASKTVQKENVHAKTRKASNLSPYVSHASRSISGERRTLSELQPKVADDSDISITIAEPQAQAAQPAKSTRFSSSQPKNTGTPSKSPKLNDRLEEVLRSKYTPIQMGAGKQNYTAASNTPNPTQQSFLVPNIPDISQLFSGTFKDGIPVSIRGGKVQNRSLSGGHGTPKGHSNFEPVEAIPLPQDEKDLYDAIELLTAKVEVLEIEKVDLYNEIDDLKAKNKDLERTQRPDSAVGMDDSGSGYGNDNNQNLMAEKSKLEADVESLQNQLEIAERKITTLESRLKTHTAERDQAIDQLTRVFRSSEQLKGENELHIREVESLQNRNDALSQENDDLKMRLSQILADQAANTRTWREKESNLHERIERRERAVKEMHEVTQEIYETTQEITTTNPRAARTSSRARNSKRSSINPAPQQSRPHMKEMTTKSTSRGRKSTGQISESKEIPMPAPRQSRSQSQPRQQSARVNIRTEGSQENVKDVIGQENDAHTDIETTFDDLTKTAHKDIDAEVQDSFTGDEGSDYASILGDGVMSKLRATLRAKQNELASMQQDDTVSTMKSTRSYLPISSGEPVGILKNGIQNQGDATGRLNVNNQGVTERDDTLKSNASHGHHYFETSVHERTTRRRATIDDMTSAFIIPDISMQFENHSKERPVLSASAVKVFHNLCKHNEENCTLCTKIRSANTETEQKQSVRVEKPIPVSERMPIATLYEEEPTIRPSVEPGLALATVIKGLEDEVTHLRMKQASLMAQCNQLDVSVKKRYRKSLQTDLAIIAKSIDLKADQIYALYDVLEGQKMSGQQMTEKEVEVTLTNIGVNPNNFRQQNDLTQKLGEDDETMSNNDEDSDLDLPWEGIEDTTGSFHGVSKRKSWAA